MSCEVHHSPVWGSRHLQMDLMATTKDTFLRIGIETAKTFTFATMADQIDGSERAALARMQI